MLEDYIPLSLNVLVFILHIIILFLLVGIKARINKKIIPSLIFLMISFFSIMWNNLLDVLIVSQVTFISYLKYFLMISFSFFFFLTAISFYRILKRFNDGNKTKNNKKRKKRKSR